MCPLVILFFSKGYNGDLKADVFMAATITCSPSLSGNLGRNVQRYYLFCMYFLHLRHHLYLDYHSL